MPPKNAKTQKPNLSGPNGNCQATLDSRWIIQIEGRDFVKYPGLLDLGHQKGIESIEVEALQLPNESNHNFAVVRAHVTSKTGESFSDLGDANPQNCSSKVSKHLLRMASTRAIARALRSFTNVGITALEELDDSDLANGNGNGSSNASPEPPRPREKRQYTRRAAKPASESGDNPGPHPVDNPTPPPATSAPSNGDKPSPPMSDAQKRAIWAIAKRKGVSEDQLKTLSVDIYGLNISALSIRDASSFITHLQNMQAAA